MGAARKPGACRVRLGVCPAPLRQLPGFGGPPAPDGPGSSRAGAGRAVPIIGVPARKSADEAADAGEDR